MDNHKSRGLEHRQAKNKYKRTKNVIPEVKKLAIPKAKPAVLESNWDRYEINEEEQPQLNSSTDFSILANIPISRGSHFQFKCDKVSNYDLTEVDTKNKLFELDLNLFNKSLACIPFYERVGLPIEMFSKNQQSYIQATALKNRVEYETYLKEKNLNINNQYKSNFENNETDEFAAGFSEEKCLDSSEEICEQLERQTLLDKGENYDKEEDKVEEEDLEKWLDNILDE